MATTYSSQEERQKRTSNRPTRHYYGVASDINLAKQTGLAGDNAVFHDISGYGEGSKYSDLLHSYKTGGNPIILGGAGATGGVGEDLYERLARAGANITRIGGKDRYEVQDNFKDFIFNQRTDPDKYRTEDATLEDLKQKYGFDYSREYAKRQSEAEAQAKRDAIEAQRERVQSEKELGQQSMNQDFFQQFRQMQQGIVNSGLNAGLEADRQNRLAMSRQNALGELLAETALANRELDRDASRIETERLAQEEELFNERLRQAFEQLQQLDDQSFRENQATLGAWLDRYRTELGQRNIEADQEWRKYTYQHLSAAEREQFDRMRDQFGEDMAWRYWNAKQGYDAQESQNNTLADYYNNLNF